VVATARDEQLRTIVAIKMLRSRDTELQRRFAREAEMLANITHPSIVRVLAHGREGEDVYMALELIEGPNLGEHLAASGPLPWRQVVEIGIQIADALDTVHRKGLIHRDVKPANIMLARDGTQLRVTLLDFGFARITEDYREPAGFTPEPRRRTDVGMAIGTPGYLPIEAGLVPADERFDVFALGVTLYELLTGELPGIEPIRPLDEVNPACDAPPDLWLVLAAALALEPEDRTQSAAELGRALEAIRTAHPERRTSTRLDGRYELLGLLGTGAKGDIYLANHRSGHDVALKFLRATDPHDLRRFEREAKLLALLDTPGLPRFFDYAPDAERPYIAMARAPGVPAVRFCRTSDKIRLKPAEVAEVGLQLARVLALLHERGVLHRDLNANNVMIELHRTPRVTLLDLGCAALTGAYYAHASLRYLTPPEARVDIPDGGIETLAWSAPEVRAGQGWSDRSDVYSLGLLLYRLLTGKLPARAPMSSRRRSCVRSASTRSVARARPSSPSCWRRRSRARSRSMRACWRWRPPSGRPALRLVPTGPQAPTDWTEHPIPEADSEPLTPAVPRPAASAVGEGQAALALGHVDRRDRGDGARRGMVARKHHGPEDPRASKSRRVPSGDAP
jgi:serine/threonine protein kinase